MTAIHQLLALPVNDSGLVRHVVLVREALRASGFRSELFVAGDPATAQGGLGPAHPLEEFRSGAVGSVMVYHALAGPSAWDVVRYIFLRSEPLVTWSYGITTMFATGSPWSTGSGRAEADLAEQLRLLSARTAVGVGTCRKVERELIALGYLATRVAPVLSDDEETGEEPGEEPGEREPEGPARWIAAGPVSPESRLERLIEALAVYRRAYDPGARLTVAGATGDSAYSSALRNFVSVCGLDGSVEFVEQADDVSGTARLWIGASVFVSASARDTTGWGISRSWRTGVPVVVAAREGEAGGEGPGVLRVPENSPAHLAAAVHRLVVDPPARAGLVGEGRRRASALCLARTRERLRTVLEEITGLWEAAA